jgi:phosphoserine phosphatase
MQAITAQTMRGELDFEASLRHRVSLLKGLHRSKLEQLLNELPYMPGAKTLMATMRQLGVFTVVVSGGFTPFTQQLKHTLHLNAEHANQLHWDENACLTGTVAEPILGKEAKLQQLHAYCQQLGLPLSASLAVGDGANDLPMLQASGMGVAFRAKPIVAKQAAFCVQHGDLTALLYLQGLPASAWTLAE